MTRSDEVFGELPIRLGLGLLRLCTEGRPADVEAMAVVHAALAKGIRILDTADVYSRDESELHFGEHLARQALKTWKGPAAEVRILTKAGLARAGRRWIPNGRPQHLRQAVAGSLTALGVERLYLLQLHARDPRVPFEETLGTLAELQREGKVQHLGLCNASAAEVLQAQRHFTVAAVQNELSVLNRKNAADGLLQFTKERGIPFLAHRPLGGFARKTALTEDPILVPLAERHQRTPHEVALAALLDAGEHVIPLIGATRVASVHSSLRALDIKPDASDRMAISIRYSFNTEAGVTTAGPADDKPADVGSLPADRGPGDSPEVVLMMGIQGAGKSELVQQYVDHGYVRLNRDLLGGKLDDLVPRLEQHLADGETRVVLDNTYPTRLSRAPVIAAAWRHSIAVRCRYLQTSLQDAQFNIAQRMIAKYGMPLGPDEMKMFRKVDPTLPPPAALARWAASFEPPCADEGFSAVDRIPFLRRGNPHRHQKGLLLDVDGTLRKTRSGEIYPKHPDDIEVLPRRSRILREWVAAGYQLFFVSNQSGVASLQVSHDTVQAAFLRTQELLEVPVTEIVYCPHPARPMGCFCRKPMPGLGVYLMERHQLASESLVMVGDRDSDAEFAAAISANYFDAETFFGRGGPKPKKFGQMRLF